MSYRRFPLDLTNVIVTPTEIVGEGALINEVFIMKMPTGVSISLLFGRGDPIDIDSPVTFAPKGASEQNRGLFWTNPVALPGSKVDLYVSMGDDGVSRETGR